MLKILTVLINETYSFTVLYVNHLIKWNCMGTTHGTMSWLMYT